MYYTTHKFVKFLEIKILGGISSAYCTTTTEFTLRGTLGKFALDERFPTWDTQSSWLVRGMVSGNLQVHYKFDKN